MARWVTVKTTWSCWPFIVALPLNYKSQVVSLSYAASSSLYQADFQCSVWRMGLSPPCRRPCWCCGCQVDGSSGLKMEAVCSSETFVPTRRDTPVFHICVCFNLFRQTRVLFWQVIVCPSLTIYGYGNGHDVTVLTAAAVLKYLPC
jgi:hypothetical protein